MNTSIDPKIVQRASLLLALVLMAGCGGSATSDRQSRSTGLIQQQGTLAVAVTDSGPALVGQPQTFVTVITNPTANAIDNVVGGVGVYTLNGTASSAKSTQGACPRNGPAQFVCFFGTIAAGASITVTSVVVPTDAGTFIFESGANALNDGTSDFTTIDIAPQPTDVQVTGFASTSSPARGAAFSYTFQVKNNGPFTADAVTFSDTLPAALPAGSATASTGTCNVTGQTVSCALGDLAVGAQATIVIATSAPQAPQTISNTASVATTTPERNPANNSVTVTVQVK